MTNETDISKVLIEGDIATIMGVKYQRIIEPQSFYDKLWGLLKTKLGDGVECDDMADQVRDLNDEINGERHCNKCGHWVEVWRKVWK